MSVHYLLDGYNILKQKAGLRDLPLEEGRKGLLKWIEEGRPQGSANNAVTVVFDGHPDHFGGGHPGSTRVVFSQGWSADDEIKRMVEDDGDRKNCVVVSDDKDILMYVRSLGAKVMRVADFVAKSRQPGSSGTSESKYIPLSRQEKINQELKDRWLKEK